MTKGYKNAFKMHSKCFQCIYNLTYHNLHDLLELESELLIKGELNTNHFSFDSVDAIYIKLRQFKG